MSHEDTTLELATDLPDQFPSAKGTGNYNLLDPIAKELDKHTRNIEEADLATNVQNKMAPDRHIRGGETYVVRDGEVEYYNELVVDGEVIVRGGLAAAELTVNGTVEEDGGTIAVDDAFVINRLAEIGKLVNLPPNEAETVSHYRARLIVEFALLSSEGTIRDLLTTVAEIFDIDVERIGFSEPSGGENGTVELQFPSGALDEQELSGSEISNILDRFVAASYRVVGLSVGTFTYITPEDYNLGNIDASKGYDGLDANGDPKDNGGTYAGTI